MTSEDYAAMVAGAGHDTLFGIPGAVTHSATLMGDRNTPVIASVAEIGDQTLSIALEALPEMGAPKPS